MCVCVWVSVGVLFRTPDLTNELILLLKQLFGGSPHVMKLNSLMLRMGSPPAPILRVSIFVLSGRHICKQLKTDISDGVQCRPMLGATDRAVIVDM